MFHNQGQCGCVDCSVVIIYTVILFKSVCRISQATGLRSCSIVSEDISNCLYRLSCVCISVRSSNLCIGGKTPKTSAIAKCSVDRQRHVGKGDNCGHNDDRFNQNGKKSNKSKQREFNNNNNSIYLYSAISPELKFCSEALVTTLA